ncbi:hypothetical protein JW978_04535 [Candidatus Dojkabacteria bacterium]|nr:hypothetical protein [Candidatus Dojkabacteria bacterium]
MKIQKKYFVGKNRPGVWASVYAYRPNDAELLSRRGEIFAAVLLEGPKEFESSIAGNLLLDILHETYFESTKKSTLEALEEAVRAVKNRLMSLVENDDSAAISGINFDLVSLVIKGRYFYSVRIGDGVLKIYRGGSLQDLSAGFKDPTGVGDFEVVSSFAQPKDVLFLGTPATSEEYSHDEIFESVNEYNEIGLKNKMMEDDSKIAFLMVGVELKSDGEEVLVQENIVDLQESEDKDAGNAPVSPVDGFSAQKEQASGLKAKFKKYKEKITVGAASLRDKGKNKFASLKGGRKPLKQADIEPAGEADLNEVSAKEPSVKSPSEQTTFMMIVSSIWRKTAKMLKEIYLFVKKDLLAIEDKGIFLKGRQRSMNYRVLAAVIILVVIVLYGAIRIRQNTINNARTTKANEALVEEIESKLNEISTSSVFTIPTPDNISARERVYSEIVSLKDRIDSTKITKEYEDRILSSQSELESLELQLLRIIPVNDPSPLSDLGAVFEGAVPSDIAVVSSRVFVSDSARNVIYEIDKQGGEEVYFDEGLSSPRYICGDPDGDLVVLDESSTALGTIDLKSNDMTRFPGMTSDKFTNTVEIETYKVADGDIRLYLAMSTSPQVQQINKIGSSYSAAPQSRWAGDDLSGLSDISLLDGKFIMIKIGEGIVRYYVNSKITTNISGLLNGDNINSADGVATDALYIYVADSANKRVLVFDKARGENVDFVDLIAQFKYDGGFDNIKDIAVDTDNIYVLDGAKVYKLAKSDFQSFTY